MTLAQSHLLRRGRFSEPGRIYLLTTITYQRRPLFIDFRHARIVIQQLRLSDLERACNSLAWVVMPDHLHWLIELQEVTLATLMRRLKSHTGIGLRRAGVRHEPIWQAGYQDRALRREDDVRKVELDTSLPTLCGPV